MVWVIDGDGYVSGKTGVGLGFWVLEQAIMQRALWTKQEATFGICQYITYQLDDITSYNQVMGILENIRYRWAITNKLQKVYLVKNQPALLIWRICISEFESQWMILVWSLILLYLRVYPLHISRWFFESWCNGNPVNLDIATIYDLCHLLR